MLPPIFFARALVLAFAVLGVLSFLSSVLVGDFLPVELTSALFRGGSSWFFMSLYLFLIFLVLDILRLTPLPVGKILSGNQLSFAILVGATAIVALLGYLNYRSKDRVELTIDIPKSSGLKDLTVVAISDLHLGYGVDEREFSQWVEIINKENPDVVLIAGDAIDNSMRPIREGHYEEVFRSITSKYGIYMALGNHEYITGANAAVKYLRDAGVNVLRDEVALVDDRFYVVGRDDRSNPNRKGAEELIANLDITKPVILLDHQPFDLEEAERHGVDLQLSGHTHHGQIWPISWITEAIYEKARGYLRKGNTHIYVSSGIGVWGGKFRIGTRSEYVVVNLSAVGDH